jgi:hypothetical protein
MLLRGVSRDWGDHAALANGGRGCFPVIIAWNCRSWRHCRKRSGARVFLEALSRKKPATSPTPDDTATAAP